MCYSSIWVHNECVPHSSTALGVGYSEMNTAESLAYPDSPVGKRRLQTSGMSDVEVEQDELGIWG